jgi:hypothetical protein
MKTFVYAGLTSGDGVAEASSWTQTAPGALIASGPLTDVPHRRRTFVD